MALLALINLGLVLFDLSYIPWRDFYLREFPQFTRWYGNEFKGIEPYRFTENYLVQVQQLANQVTLMGLQSPEVAARLSELNTLSEEMIDENPFEAAGKSGTLERIKQRLRDRVGVESSKDAFNTFWSQRYLSEAGWQNSIDFFNQDIQPLMATNYFRQIGFDGNPINQFWKIDIWFVAIFGLEFLVRTIYLSRRYKGTSWLDAVIWRWYDILLLIPFWRWLRVIPVIIRINQSNLINLDPIYNRVIRNLISSVSVEVTEMVIVRIIDQTQDALAQGDLIKWLLDPTRGRRYIDLNGINEVEVISQRLTNVLVYQVLPKVRPELEALLQHTVTSVLNSSPIYTGLTRLPGVKDWSNQLAHQLVTEISENGYQALTASLEDEMGADLFKRLLVSFGNTFQTEIQRDEALDELRALSIAFLDEIKINYIERVEAEDIEVLRERKKALYGMTQGASRGLLQTDTIQG
ncbi:MAG: hypothetical protein Kow00121_13830 [Elainellaceae cyanobacterium]